MPKEITHIVFADETLKQISQTDLFKNISQSTEFYQFGSLAVDSFYYNLEIPFVDKNYVQWGDMVHAADGNNPFIPIYKALEELKNLYTNFSISDNKYKSPLKKEIYNRYERDNEKKDFNNKLAFICGYLTHCALDINFHPFVYYFSGNYYNPDKEESINAQMRHRLIEGWIDYYLVKQNPDEYSVNTTFKAFSDDVTNLKLLDFLSNHYSNSWKGDKKNINESLIRGYFIQKTLNSLFDNKSFKNSVRFLNKMSQNKLRGYLALFYPDTYDIPDYIINTPMFKNPVTGEEHNQDFHELWKQALKLSSSFLNAVNEYIFNNNESILKDTIKGYSLDVGLIEVPVKEVKYFSPWDLVP